LREKTSNSEKDLNMAYGKKQKTLLSKHATHHTKGHMDEMKTGMKKGSTFKAAHKKAQKKVGT